MGYLFDSDHVVLRPQWRKKTLAALLISSTWVSPSGRSGSWDSGYTCLLSGGPL